MTMNAPEPSPVGGGAEVWPQVVRDMEERNRVGFDKYGTSLRVGNGRAALMDAYQELLDLTVYLRQFIMEDNDRKARLQIKLGEMRRGAEGLTMSQEQAIYDALGWTRGV